MAELTEQQLESAKQELAKVFGGPMDDVLMTNMLRAAAPFLQLPWDEPSEQECEQFYRLNSQARPSPRSALEDFVRRRNATLMEKPVAETIEEQLAGAKRACRLALNAFERDDAIDWAEVEKYAAPEFQFGFTGFKPLDSAERDHMYRTSVLERPRPPREEFKKNPADMPQPVDPRKAAIVKMFADVPGSYSTIGPGNRGHVADMILAALDAVK